jgi:uncharacterized protein YlxW (UPF0749 family)
MNGEIFAIVLVAIICGYKLLSQIITAIVRDKPAQRESRRQKTHSQPIQEDPAELRARAERLQKRIATLEEIIASERAKEGVGV